MAGAIFKQKAPRDKKWEFHGKSNLNTFRKNTRVLIKTLTFQLTLKLLKIIKTSTNLNQNLKNPLLNSKLPLSHNIWRISELTLQFCLTNIYLCSEFTLPTSTT